MQDYEEVTDPKILAQLNAPAVDMNQYEEVTDPKILAQLNAPDVPRETSEQQNDPSITDRAMISFLNQQSPLGPTKDYDPLASKDNVITKIGKGFLDYAPYGVGAASLLKYGSKLPALIKLAENSPRLAGLLTGTAAENILGGATYGGMNADTGNTMAAAALGGLGGGAASMLGGAGNIVANYLGKKYAQSAIPAFTKKATEQIKSLLPSSDYAQQLFGRFSDAFSKNKGNWNAVKDSAEQLDTAIGKNFNNRPYHDYIDGYLSDLNKLDPAQRAQYAQSILLAQKAKEIAPESFSGIVASRQNLNQVLSDFLDPTGQTKPDIYSKQFITGLKNNLKNETLEANAGNIHPDAFNDFKSKWENANQSHQNLQDFYKSMQGTTGTVKKMTPTEEMYKSALETGNLDPSILNRYAPPLTLKGSQGIEGINQLNRLYGDPQTARDAIQASLFRRPTQQGASTIDSAKIYSDMSPAQRQAVFGNSPQGQMLDAINNTRLEFGREPEKTLAKIGHHAMSWGVPGALGVGTGLASGEDWPTSVGFGVGAMLGAQGLKHAVGRTATPASVARAIQLGKSSPFTGRYINPLLQMLNPLTGNQ